MSMGDELKGNREIKKERFRYITQVTTPFPSLLSPHQSGADKEADQLPGKISVFDERTKSLFRSAPQQTQ